MRNRVEPWPFWVLRFSGEGPLAPSWAVDTSWTENGAGICTVRPVGIYRDAIWS